MVPTTAKKVMVPILSKNVRFGMKKPESKIIGGSMQKKKMVDERGDNTEVFVI